MFKRAIKTVLIASSVGMLIIGLMGCRTAPEAPLVEQAVEAKPETPEEFVRRVCTIEPRGTNIHFFACSGEYRDGESGGKYFDWDQGIFTARLRIALVEHPGLEVVSLTSSLEKNGYIVIFKEKYPPTK